VIAFKDPKWTIETFEKLPEGTQPQISVQELIRCEEIVKKDPTVQKLAKDVGSFAQALFVSQMKTGTFQGFFRNKYSWMDGPSDTMCGFLRVSEFNKRSCLLGCLNMIIFMLTPWYILSTLAPRCKFDSRCRILYLSSIHWPGKSFTLIILPIISSLPKASQS